MQRPQGNEVNSEGRAQHGHMFVRRFSCLLQKLHIP